MYIPLPDCEARKELFRVIIHISDQKIHLGLLSNLQEEDFEELAKQTESYSGSDISIVVNDALMEPLRELECSSFWKKEEGENGHEYVPCSPNHLSALEINLRDIPSSQVGVPRLVSLVGVGFCLTKNDLLSSVKRNPYSQHSELLNQYIDFTSKFGQMGSQ